ncbi:MAG: RluA family pseudouridine synthase [Methyloligellaceae bacterium]
MSEKPGQNTFHVTLEHQGERLDRFLSCALGDISRSRIKVLIKDGHVSQNGSTIVEPNYRVKSGESFRIIVPEPEPAVPRPESIPLTVVFEDESLIVIDKPAGMVVHPAVGNWQGTLVNALIAHCGDSLSGIGGVRRPGIVHRLDKDTSGLIVVAKNDAAHRALAAQFASHGCDGHLERSYAALVWGVPARPKGRIETGMERKAGNRQKMVAVTAGGKQAVTHYEVKNRLPPGDVPLASLVECVLETGRTHQIRVHMAHIGHPLLGDMTYGAGFAASARKLSSEAYDALEALGRQALHAQSLGFIHPGSGHKMKFESALPADFAALITAMASQ